MSSTSGQDSEVTSATTRAEPSRHRCRHRRSDSPSPKRRGSRCYPPTSDGHSSGRERPAPHPGYAFPHQRRRALRRQCLRRIPSSDDEPQGTSMSHSLVRPARVRGTLEECLGLHASLVGGRHVVRRRPQVCRRHHGGVRGHPRCGASGRRSSRKGKPSMLPGRRLTAGTIVAVRHTSKESWEKFRDNTLIPRLSQGESRAAHGAPGDRLGDPERPLAAWERHRPLGRRP